MKVSAKELIGYSTGELNEIYIDDLLSEVGLKLIIKSEDDCYNQFIIKRINSDAIIFSTWDPFDLSKFLEKY